MSLQQPLADLEGFYNLSASDIKIGIFERYFKDSDASVYEASKHCLEQLKTLGANIIPIDIPGLNDMRSAHSIIIVSELSSATAHLPVKEFTYTSRIIWESAKNIR
jgi:Asp-tRNA(Asn)/Glu-tRNA(Gln) amidotransferase A subunit family amidase